jgi:hypothetical protein
MESMALKQESAIMALLVELRTRHEGLAATIGMLGERLAPVLRPDTNEKDVVGKTSEPRPESEVELRLLTENSYASEMKLRCESLLRRLAV